jgi:hypothetical protein
MANVNGAKAQPEKSAKTKTRGRDNIPKAPQWPSVGGERRVFDLRSEVFPAIPGAVTAARGGSSIRLAMEFRPALGPSRPPTTGVELTLTVPQAEALEEVLKNFLRSRETNHRATTPVIVGLDGSTRWGTHPRAI